MKRHLPIAASIALGLAIGFTASALFTSPETASAISVEDKWLHTYDETATPPKLGYDNDGSWHPPMSHDELLWITVTPDALEQAKALLQPGGGPVTVDFHDTSDPPDGVYDSVVAD